MIEKNKIKAVDITALASQLLTRLEHATISKAKIEQSKVGGKEEFLDNDCHLQLNHKPPLPTMLPPLDMGAIRYDFEERIAIMMYDGGVLEREAINSALEEILQNLSTYTL